MEVRTKDRRRQFLLRLAADGRLLDFFVTTTNIAMIEPLPIAVSLVAAPSNQRKVSSKVDLFEICILETILSFLFKKIKVILSTIYDLSSTLCPWIRSRYRHEYARPQLESMSKLSD